MRSKLFNVTAASNLVFGTTGFTYGNPAGGNVYSHISGRFSIGAPSTLELRAFNAVTGGSSISGGTAISSGDPEIYTDLMIWQIG
jgi:hypothetical protein